MKNKYKETRWYRILSELADELHEKWLLCCTLQSLPVIWTVIYQIKKDWFVDEGSNLNIKGILFATLCCSSSLFLILITNVKSSRELKRRENYNEAVRIREAEVLVHKATSSAESSLDERYHRLLKEYMESGKPIDVNTREFLSKAYDPNKRINAVLDEVSYCFEKISTLPRDRIYMSAAIKAGSEDWKWISKINTSGTATLKELLDNPSMFRKVAKEGLPYVFANDKKAALDKNEYYWDRRDDSNSNQGSIICWGISQTIRNISLNLIISISTYGERICERDDISEEDIRSLYEDVIKDTILCRFEGRLSEALILYAIQERVIKPSMQGNRSVTPRIVIQNKNSIHEI